MSSVAIATLIAAGIIVMVVVAFIAQSLENARQERHRRVLALLDHARQLNNVLNAIPDAYIPNNLHTFVSSEIKRCYREALILEPKHAQAQTQLQQLETAESRPEPNLDSLSPVFDDQVTGQRIRSEMKQLVNHIVQLHTDGLVDRNLAQQQINQGKTLFSLVNIDLNLVTARTMEQSENIRAALNHYRTCLKHTEKLHAHLNLPNRVNYLQNKVAALEEQVNELVKQQEALKNKEDEEWRKLEEAEQASWKIKHDYE